MVNSDRLREDITLTVVLPVFNEQAVLRQLAESIETLFALPISLEIIFVNDGSTDESASELDRLADEKPHVKVVHLSRNFGQQAAVQAGLLLGSGDVFAVMDSDMQDAPEAVPEMLEKWRHGYDVVYAVRTKRKETFLTVFLYHSFYKLLSMISTPSVPMDAGIFGLIDGRIAKILGRLPECDRFYPGMRSWIGFRQVGVEVERRSRYDKTPRQSLIDHFSLARTAIFSASSAPLFMFYALSAVSLLTFFGFAVFCCYHKFVTGLAIPGWTSNVMTACLFGSLNSLGIAILGEYVVRIYAQVRARPSFLIERTVNLKCSTEPQTQDSERSPLA